MPTTTKTLIFNMTDAFPGKVNFIDTEDVLLGYDLSQSCRENALWSVGHKKDGSDPLHTGDGSEKQEIELEGYTFDPAFHESEENDGEESYYAIFRLVFRSYSSKKPDLFIRLENHHNGYYSHGFTFKGTEVISGDL